MTDKLVPLSAVKKEIEICKGDFADFEGYWKTENKQEIRYVETKLENIQKKIDELLSRISKLGEKK